MSKATTFKSIFEGAAESFGRHKDAFVNADGVLGKLWHGPIWGSARVAGTTIGTTAHAGFHAVSRPFVWTGKGAAKLWNAESKAVRYTTRTGVGVGAVGAGYAALKPDADPGVSQEATEEAQARLAQNEQVNATLDLNDQALMAQQQQAAMLAQQQQVMQETPQAPAPEAAQAEQAVAEQPQQVAEASVEAPAYASGESSAVEGRYDNAPAPQQPLPDYPSYQVATSQLAHQSMMTPDQLAQMPTSDMPRA